MPLHGSQPCHGKGAGITERSYEARSHQDGWVILKSLDKQNAVHWRRKWNPLQLESMKRQKDMMLEDEIPRLECIQYLPTNTGEEWRAITSE